MKTMEIVNNQEFGDVRIVQEDDKLLFGAKDVATALGYKDSTNAIKRHCKGVAKRHLLTNGGRQELSFIPESDVYRLIVHSKLPSAERFEKWLFEEVLPSIRKNGGYIVGQDEISEDELMARALIVAKKTLEDREARILALKEQNEAMAPKAEYFDRLVERNLLTNFRETAKEIGVKEREFIRFLLDRKYIYRDIKGGLMPYANRNDGLFEVKEAINPKSGWVGLQTLVTPKGRQTFGLLYWGQNGGALG